MFGRHSRNRERAKQKQSRAGLEQEKMAWESQNPEREKQTADFEKSQIAEKVQSAKQQRLQARGEGRDYAHEVLNRDVQGMAPEKRRALQSEANISIRGNLENAQRKLLGEQGIRGRSGGVADEQRRALDRDAQAAEAGVHRDLDKMNSDLALKKLAAGFNIEQGEAAQQQLDRQLAEDEIRLNKERKNQGNYINQSHRAFSRI